MAAGAIPAEAKFRRNAVAVQLGKGTDYFSHGLNTDDMIFNFEMCAIGITCGLL